MESDAAIAPRAGVPLAPLTTLGVGGHAQWFARATSGEEVAAAHRWCIDRSLPLLVLGGGSNLVIADSGVEGLVLHVVIPGIDVAARNGGTAVRVGAGVPWDEVVKSTVSAGLAGLECLSGIPGSTGGTPVQNVGAYGQEVGDTLVEVVVFDRAADALATLSGTDCGFAYRTSRFKREDAGRFVVCEVTFGLRPGPPTVVYPDVITHLERTGTTSPTLADVREAVLAIRRRKGMVLDESDPDTRSVGSFFMNPVVSTATHAALTRKDSGTPPGFKVGADQVKIPAAWLIERSGFSRGYGCGPVGLSSKHPLAIVNRGLATARDVLGLAARIKRGVVDRFGIWLTPEPAFVGFGDDADVAYLLEKHV